MNIDEQVVYQFIGWLSGDVQELNRVEVPSLAASWERFKLAYQRGDDRAHNIVVNGERIEPERRLRGVTSLTHTELLLLGLCISMDNQTIDLFDMAAFKQAQVRETREGVEGPDTWTKYAIAEVKDIAPEALNILLASFHLYQTVFRISVSIPEITSLINRGDKTCLDIAATKLNEIQQIIGLSRRIAIEGAMAVAADMGDRSMTRLDEPFK